MNGVSRSHVARRVSIIVSALLIALAQVAPAPTAATANTLYVGQAPAGAGSCSGPDFSTLDLGETDAIQAAIDEANRSPKYRVIVICAGRYDLTDTLEFAYDHRPVELRGEGVTTLDGANTYRIIDANGKDGFGDPGPRSLVLTIRNMKLANGYAGDWGGAIQFNGRLNLHDVEINDNVADLGGSAIDNDGSGEITDVLYITNSSIYDNISDGDGGEGGAVNVNGGTVIAANSVFEANNVDGTTRGGAIHATHVGVKGSIFEDNVAEDGGAIYAYGSLSIDRSTFIYNESRADGGAIYAEGLTSISNSDFVDNDSGAYGGAISFNNLSQDLKINGSEFDGNAAGEEGGAISFYGRNLGVRTSDFLENSATEMGGAIYTYDAAQVSIIQSDFGHSDDDSRGNSTLTHGGDIASLTGASETIVTKMRITDSNFYFGHAEDAGGSMFLICTEAVVTRVTIQGATSGSEGAGIYAGDSLCSTNYYVTVHSSRFTDNANDDQGGAIASEQGAAGAFLGFKVFNSLFKGNEADSGAAINVDQRVLQVTGSTFEDNHTFDSGGALELCGADLTVIRSRFVRNSADNSAGAIMTNCEGVARIDRNDFIDNHANSNFGALGIADASVWGATLTSNRFLSNDAGESGGAVGVYFPEGTIDLTWLASWTRNIFEDNDADYGDHVWLNYEDDSERSSDESLLEHFTERNGIIDPEDGWLHQS